MGSCKRFQSVATPNDMFAIGSRPSSASRHSREREEMNRQHVVGGWAKRDCGDLQIHPIRRVEVR